MSLTFLRSDVHRGIRSKDAEVSSGLSNSISPASDISFLRPGSFLQRELRHLPCRMYVEQGWRGKRRLAVWETMLKAAPVLACWLGFSLPLNPHFSWGQRVYTPPYLQRPQAAGPSAPLPPLQALSPSLGCFLLQWLYLFFHLRNANQKKPLFLRK